VSISSRLARLEKLAGDTANTQATAGNRAAAEEYRRVLREVLACDACRHWINGTAAALDFTDDAQADRLREEATHLPLYDKHPEFFRGALAGILKFRESRRTHDLATTD
jgi:hypothetical protein